MASLESHVAGIAQQASLRLTKVWDEMGLDDSERRARGSEVFRAVEEAFAQLIASETSRRDTMQSAVQEAVAAIAQIASELGEPMVVVVLSPSSGYQLMAGLARQSLQRQHEALMRRLDDLERMRFERIEQMTRLLSRIEALEEIISLPETDTGAHSHTAPQLSTQQMGRLHARLDALEGEQSRRMRVASESIVAVVALWRELGEGAVTPFERTVLRAGESVSDASGAPSIAVSDANIDALGQLRASLEGERRSRHAQMSQMAARIHVLWERLDVTVTERDAFGRRNAGLSRAALDAHRNELGRLEGLKAANVARFVLIAKEDLRRAWDQCHVSADQRAMFPAFDDDCPMDDDERLRALEEETERLTAHRRDNEELYAAIERRIYLWSELERMEIEGNDPGRLSNRGGMLLKEEKLRNAIVRELPRLRDKIVVMATQCEARTGRYFLVNGERYLHVMDAEEETHRQFKEDQRRLRMRPKDDAHTSDASGAHGAHSTPGKKVGATGGPSKFKTMPTTPGSTRKTPAATPSSTRKPATLPPSTAIRAAAAVNGATPTKALAQPAYDPKLTATTPRRVLGEMGAPPQQQAPLASYPKTPTSQHPSHTQAVKAVVQSHVMHPQPHLTPRAAGHPPDNGGVASFNFAAFAENIHAVDDDICSYDDFEFDLNQTNMKHYRSSEMPQHEDCDAY